MAVAAEGAAGCTETGRGRVQEPERSGFTGAAFTQKTVNSAGSGLVFVRVSDFGSNSVKYTNPDGRWTFSNEQGKSDCVWRFINNWYQKNTNNRRGTLDLFSNPAGYWLTFG
jgi:hypothetical protein